jgi:hypothetical protein
MAIYQQLTLRFSSRPHLSSSHPQLPQVPPPHRNCEKDFGLRICGIGCLHLGQLIAARLIPPPIMPHGADNHPDDADEQDRGKDADLNNVTGDGCHTG